MENQTRAKRRVTTFVRWSETRFLINIKVALCVLHVQIVNLLCCLQVAKTFLDIKCANRSCVISSVFSHLHYVQHGIIWFEVSEVSWWTEQLGILAYSKNVRHQQWDLFHKSISSTKPEVHLYLSPVTPPVSLLHKDSVVMDIRLLPEQDLLKLPPLKGAICQLPSLLLKTAHKVPLNSMYTNNSQHHPHEHELFAKCNCSVFCLFFSSNILY